MPRFALRNVGQAGLFGTREQLNIGLFAVLLIYLHTAGLCEALDRFAEYGDDTWLFEPGNSLLSSVRRVVNDCTPLPILAVSIGSLLLVRLRPLWLAHALIALAILTTVESLYFFLRYESILRWFDLSAESRMLDLRAFFAWLAGALEGLYGFALALLTIVGALALQGQTHIRSARRDADALLQCDSPSFPAALARADLTEIVFETPAFIWMNVGRISAVLALPAAFGVAFAYMQSWEWDHDVLIPTPNLVRGQSITMTAQPWVNVKITDDHSILVQSRDASFNVSEFQSAVALITSRYRDEPAILLEIAPETRHQAVIEMLVALRDAGLRDIHFLDEDE